MKSSFKKIGVISVPLIAVIIVFVMIFGSVFNNRHASKVSAANLMEKVKSQNVKTVKLDNNFIKSTADFSVDLFKSSYKKDKNSLISPTSVYLALGMTANGADKNTLKEFESLLGGNINLKDLNTYYYSLSKDLTNIEGGKLSIANSIWYRDSQTLSIKEDFLQTNADYYNASAYKSDFSSTKTVKDINNWVKNNTGGLIDNIIDSIDADTIMYLINAVYFENQWEKPYTKSDIRKDTFNLSDGTNTNTDFMYSAENYYLKDDKAEGFMKQYKDNKYSFVALLPNDGVSIDSYVASLSGEGFLNLIKNKSEETVTTALPKFKSEYKISLVDSLKKMGLEECFDSAKANFTRMGSSSEGNIYVSNVLHKTFISVDELGTKAGAVTSVEMKSLGMALISHNIILNRPFVYAIIDNETNLPLFLGTMMSPEIK